MRRLVPVAALVLLLAVLSGATLVRDYHEFLHASLQVGEDGRVFVLDPGTSYRRMVNRLRHEGVTGAPTIYWRILAWERDLAGRIQAGEYFLEAGTTPGGLAELLVSGNVYLHPFTIVEGWTFRQLRRAIEGSELFEQTLTDLDDDALMAALGHPGVYPEGRFLPETYHFPRGAADAAVLTRSLEAMADALDQAWQGRGTGLPYETADEVLIMASIIEKETAIPAERDRIAGVFVRRLQKRMRLQTDPTVIYGLGPDFDGDIRFEDLRQDTPYNTYTRHGLPPTPIALPGVDSLQAAVHPAPGNALYFVATGDGGHVFADTLEEHNRNVAQYQKRRKP